MRLSAMERDDAVAAQEQAQAQAQALVALAGGEPGLLPSSPPSSPPSRTFLTREDFYFLIKLCNDDIDRIKERARRKAMEGDNMDHVRDTLDEVDKVKAVIGRIRTAGHL